MAEQQGERSDPKPGPISSSPYCIESSNQSLNAGLQKSPKSAAGILEENIPFLAVLAEIQTLNFLVLSDPQTHGGVQDFQNDKRAHQGDARRGENADDLREHLPGIAFQKSDGRLRTGDGPRGKHAGEQCTNRAAHAVNAEGIERIVISKLGFERGAGPETAQARSQTQHDPRQGRDRPGRRA